MMRRTADHEPFLGLGALLLSLGLLLPDQPESAGDRPDRSCPHPH